MLDEQEEVYIDFSYLNPQFGSLGINGGSNSHDWGDYDNDGDLDLIMGGGDYNGQLVLKIFNNHNGDLLFDTTQTSLVPGFPIQVKWIDINSDDYIDLLTSSGDSILVYFNNGTGLLELIENQTINLGLTAGSISVADFNSDGYDDFVLAGIRPEFNDSLITHIYKNNNGDGFILHQELQGACYGGLDWGDYDNDGDLHLISSGVSV